MLVLLMGGNNASRLKRGKREKRRKVIPSGRAFIQSSFNNTVVTLTDPEGNVLSWGSSAQQGLKVREKVLLMPLNGGSGCCEKGGKLCLRQ